jgi:hypothetical protein
MAGLAGFALFASGTLPASAATLVDVNTSFVLSTAAGDLGAPNGNLPWFPKPNTFTGEPNLVFSTEPDLSDASALGDWLGDPGNLNASWSGPSSVPTLIASWVVNQEVALIYALDVAESTSLVASFDKIDNGIHIWVNGVWKFGGRDPSGKAWDDIALGTIPAGRSYVQILLEDSGGAVNYLNPLIEGTPVPEPSLAALLGIAALALGARRLRSPS